MRILQVYIAKAVFSSIFLVLLVLLSLFTFFTFADELNKTGRGNYDAYHAMEFALLTIPRMVYELFPAAALIGTMMGLGMLASHSEITAMRAAGISTQMIIGAILKLGFILMLFVFFLGEVVAPYAETMAQTRKSVAMSKNVARQTETGLWIRDGFDVINIGDIRPGGKLSDVHIFRLNPDYQLEKITTASSARFRLDQQWLLKNVQTTLINDKALLFESMEIVQRESLLNPDIMQAVMVRPLTMPVWSLSDYVDYLLENGIDAQKYQQAFWSKVISPFSTAIMVLLAIPFIFGSTRSMSSGHRVLIGVMVGIGFHLFVQIFSYAGLVYRFPAFFAASFPTILFFLLALLLMRRLK